MPFEPSPPRRREKTHAPRRDADSFASPELEALAEQLGRDSQWLAERYPAHKPRLPLRRPQRLRWVAVGAAAVLMLLAVDGWRMWNRPASPTPTRDYVALPAPTPKAGVVLPGRRDGLSVQPAAIEARPPGLSFDKLNGAEKEAVLDLLEERAPALSTSLSL